MSEFTQAEALALIDAMRSTLVNRPGFRWMVERLTALAAYVEAVGTENAQLNAYLDQSGARADYESYCISHPTHTGNGETRDD